MKANEVRIGNFVYVFNSENKKKMLPIKDGLEIESILRNTLKIKPIRLSYKILMMCGFELINDEFVLELSSGIKIVQTNFFGMWILKYNGFLPERQIIPFELDFLHQLQNLYFCLNGEELEVKTKK
jgi:hypothetical protein